MLGKEFMVEKRDLTTIINSVGLDVFPTPTQFFNRVEVYEENSLMRNQKH